MDHFLADIERIDMNTTQPEALRLANILRGIDARSLFANEKLSAASAALENQHARIFTLDLGGVAIV